MVRDTVLLKYLIMDTERTQNRRSTDTGRNQGTEPKNGTKERNQGMELRNGTKEWNKGCSEETNEKMRQHQQRDGRTAACHAESLS